MVALDSIAAAVGECGDDNDIAEFQFSLGLPSRAVGRELCFRTFAFLIAFGFFTKSQADEPEGIPCALSLTDSGICRLTSAERRAWVAPRPHCSTDTVPGQVSLAAARRWVMGGAGHETQSLAAAPLDDAPRHRSRLQVLGFASREDAGAAQLTGAVVYANVQYALSVLHE